MEPDQRVQQTIRQVFSKFAELRSARQVLLWFRTERRSLGRTTAAENRCGGTQEGVARAEARLRSARREAVLDLQLRAGLQQNRQLLEPEVSNTYRVGLQGFVTAGVNIPVFNRNQGNTAAAKAELARAQQEVTRVQFSLRQNAQPLLAAYLAEQVEAERYRSDMIPRAARAYQLYLDKYRQMASAYPQVIISQRTLFQLRLGYIQTLENLWKSAIALQNFTLSGGLDAPAPSGNSSTTINLPNSSGGEVD